MSFVYVLLAAPGGFGPLPSNYMLVIQNSLRTMGENLALFSSNMTNTSEFLDLQI
jgi:hypothetical protein